MMTSLHKKTDELIANIEEIKKNATAFQDGYEKQLADKKNFYDEQDKYERADTSSSKKS